MSARGVHNARQLFPAIDGATPEETLHLARLRGRVAAAHERYWSNAPGDAVTRLYDAATAAVSFHTSVLRRLGR